MKDGTEMYRFVSNVETENMILEIGVPHKKEIH